jgi:hypothetical protein
MSFYLKLVRKEFILKKDIENIFLNKLKKKTKECPMCHKEFVVNKKGRKYCSHSCASRKKK